MLEPGGADIKSASACADAIVYERFGALHLFDLKTGKSQPIPVRVRGRPAGRAAEDGEGGQDDPATPACRRPAPGPSSRPAARS